MKRSTSLVEDGWDVARQLKQCYDNGGRGLREKAELPCFGCLGTPVLLEREQSADVQQVMRTRVDSLHSQQMRYGEAIFSQRHVNPQLPTSNSQGAVRTMG